MSYPTGVEKIECDILILGGGMAGCGAAYEAKYWGRKLKVVLVEKAAIERSGAVAMGLSAINLYLGMKHREKDPTYGKTPEDYVRYVRGDLMGLVREDLIYDVARHVDSTVHLFEEWGLPIYKDPADPTRYLREGPWQVLISGESYKPIIAEAGKKSADTIYERVCITHLLTSKTDPNRVAGAVGFGVRDGKFYIFRAKAVIVACGGATHIYRPRSVGEGAGRMWYCPAHAGSSFAMPIMVGAEMTQMENRFIPMRFKDAYGPVGAYFLFLKTWAENAFGENYLQTRAEDLKRIAGKYAEAKPTPTCLRNLAMLLDYKDGKFPFLMRHDAVIQKLKQEGKTKEAEEALHWCWEDFLQMTPSQALLWCCTNLDPAERPSEIMMAEPYIMGSHAGCAGAWVSGPEDIAPSEYQWGYNRMTTIKGLFAAGDAVGASAHKFSSGSFTEGRIAAKAAVRFVMDNPEMPEVDEAYVEKLKTEIFKPLELYEKGKATTSRPDLSFEYILPYQGLKRLEKIMDEYAGGPATMYTTNEKALQRGLELLLLLKEDLAKLGAKDLHDLLRCWELVHRVWTAEAHVRHMLFRKESRWPGYYIRSDYPNVDDTNWKVFVNSVYDPKTGEWKVFTRPYIQLVP